MLLLLAAVHAVAGVAGDVVAAVVALRARSYFNYSARDRLANQFPSYFIPGHASHSRVPANIESRGFVCARASQHTIKQRVPT